MKSYSMNATIATFLFLIFCTLLNGQNLNKNTSFKPVNLKTDYLEAPVGIDNPNPRLNWNIEDNSQNAKQTAYRLVVGTNFEFSPCSISLILFNHSSRFSYLSNEPEP